MTADSQRQADQQLAEILGRVRYIGQEPPPSEDEAMEMVVEEIRATRRAEAPISVRWKPREAPTTPYAIIRPVWRQRRK